MYNSISMDSNYDICKTGLNDNNLSYSQKGNKEMTLICTKINSDEIIIAADSCLNMNNGNKINIQKIFYDKAKSLVIAYAGDSSVVMNGQNIKINNIIEHHLKKNTYTDFNELRESIISDIICFLPGDKKALGQIIFAFLNSSSELKLKGYEIVREAYADIKNTKIYPIIDSDSFFFKKNELWSCGAINHQIVNTTFYKLKRECSDLGENEIIIKTIEEFSKNDDYEHIGGSTYVAILNNKGAIKTFIDGKEKEFQENVMQKQLVPDEVKKIVNETLKRMIND